MWLEERECKKINDVVWRPVGSGYNASPVRYLVWQRSEGPFCGTEESSKTCL